MAKTDIGANGPNRPLVADDIPRMVACGINNVLILHDFLDQALVYAQAGITPHCRVNWRGALRPADQEANDVNQMMQAHPEVATWRVRNEPNIESPGLTPLDWATFSYRFSAALSGMGADMRTVWLCALSPSGNWQSWLDALRGNVGLYDGLDIHAYGNPTEVANIVSVYQNRWTKPMLVSEYDFGGGRQYDLSQYCNEIPKVYAANDKAGLTTTFTFTWEWQKPDIPLPTTLNIKGTIVEKAFQDNFGGSPVPPDPIQEKLDQLLAQNAILTEQWIRFRKGDFTGADGIDGGIVALTGKPLDFVPSYPPKV